MSSSILFQFPQALQAGIEAGKFVQVFSSSGVPLGIARDAITGQFVGHAVGVMGQVGGILLNPITGIGTLVLTAVNTGLTGLQIHREGEHFQILQEGIKSLQASVGVLQATTAVIGVGVVAGVALSAVNLYQMLKLRKAVEKLELKVENGFLDLKQALKDQSQEIIQLVQKGIQDIKFEQHRLVLVRAYGLFIKAVNRLQTALYLQDINQRNAEIEQVRGMLFQALADYTNQALLGEVSAPGRLRRLECAWAIEQVIILTYQLQGELPAVSHRITDLQKQIRHESVTTLKACHSEEELDFLYPEMHRIRSHDLIMLEVWQNQSDWIKSLPPTELKEFQSTNFSNLSHQQEVSKTLIGPDEQSSYEELKQKYHPLSPRTELFLMMDQDLRQKAELYISQQAARSGSKALKLSNLQRSSALAIANHYWYFQDRNDSKNQLGSELKTVLNQ